MDGTEEEEFVPEDEAEEGPTLVKKLREKLKKAVEEKQEYLEGWQRSRADFANYKREEVGLYADREARSKADFVESLLPMLDSFEMALKHSPDNKELALVHKQLTQSLQHIGVTQFGRTGELFSPHLHEALQEIPIGDSAQDHTIESIHRAGYSIGDKIIRPAQVAVYTLTK